MKKMLTIIAGMLFVGSMALAADAENTDSAKVDTSKNPITGTKTTTVKRKKKMKDESGTSHDVSVKEKTKEMKDGTVKKSTDVDADSTSK
jgi:hypothetical protein